MWILGDSLVYWAEQRALKLGRENLHLESLGLRVQWHGHRGMVWDDLPSKLQWVGLHRMPKIIIIHLGGNDVVCTLMQKMKRIMRRDFEYLFKNFPNTIIVWSEILPRLCWRFSRTGSDLNALDKKRKRFNMLGRQMLKDNQKGRILKNDITSDCPGLFRRDGCHLSDVGTDLFCNSLQGAIEFFVTSEAKSFGP